MMEPTNLKNFYFQSKSWKYTLALPADVLDKLLGILIHVF